LLLQGLTVQSLPPRLALTATLLLAASPAAAAAARIQLGASAAESDVTVGCMFPMTGRSAIYGKDSVGGIRVALERLASGDPQRKVRIRVLVDDSRSKSAYAVRLAEETAGSWRPSTGWRGATSYVDPDTHQVAQAQAIGEVVPDARFPPAKVMLGRWVAYAAEDLKPPPEVLRARREKARRARAVAP
jgi:hypothetical protein